MVVVLIVVLLVSCEESGAGAECAQMEEVGVEHVESGEGEVQRVRGLHDWGGVNVVVDVVVVGWESCDLVAVVLS